MAEKTPLLELSNVSRKIFQIRSTYLYCKSNSVPGEGGRGGGGMRSACSTVRGELELEFDLSVNDHRSSDPNLMEIVNAK